MKRRLGSAGALLLDVRGGAEFVAGHVPSARLAKRGRYAHGAIHSWQNLAKIKAVLQGV